jgi:hypothetical protein
MGGLDKLQKMIRYFEVTVPYTNGWHQSVQARYFVRAFSKNDAIQTAEDYLPEKYEYTKDVYSTAVEIQGKPCPNTNGWLPVYPVSIPAETLVCNFPGDSFRV